MTALTKVATRDHGRDHIHVMRHATYNAVRAEKGV
ncbi:hypothetical protein DFJ69_3511 [Thermomonospora umbrina]|uniref:Uncharacterized protein n=1 Tax=Thermomonospora umbrina TaxID=111806 RepID=A0A3D9T2H6_9ACTN|nr:hypothetical protein DFJ69_3511 [Thermomonospora umbrina]